MNIKPDTPHNKEHTSVLYVVTYYITKHYTYTYACTCKITVITVKLFKYYYYYYY